MIFSKNTIKDTAPLSLDRWYNQVDEADFKSFNTIAATVYEHYDELLNFFINRSTNASAESFNAKIKAFRASLRGVQILNSSSSGCLTFMPKHRGLLVSHYNLAYTSEDLLCLYLITGGVPKYINLLMEAEATTIEKILHMITLSDSPFWDEGKDLLVSEFGREYGTYFSILQLIASGKNTQSEIDSIIEKNTGSYLVNLEKEYSLIVKK
ncbi:hypothetical protein EZS27_009819 [termite gut metagenome]|uniref:Transposase IS204/IS1001/IS1096/IS1165 DDE domain-containing protein n=1 Tax=termite gut metagenome TaxID=433724 RepID=A0A5J4S965_9ZZZZ